MKYNNPREGVVLRQALVKREHNTGISCHRCGDKPAWLLAFDGQAADEYGSTLLCLVCLRELARYLDVTLNADPRHTDRPGWPLHSADSVLYKLIDLPPASPEHGGDSQG